MCVQFAVYRIVPAARIISEFVITPLWPLRQNEQQPGVHATSASSLPAGFTILLAASGTFRPLLRHACATNFTLHEMSDEVPSVRLHMLKRWM